MSPIQIPLSPHQQARFAALREEIAALEYRKNDAVTMLVVGVCDPAALAGWAIELAETEIVCRPPAIVPPE